MMTTKMKTVLAGLSNVEIIQRGDRAIRNEHELTVVLLECLNEIERRSIYLKEGHSSLFAFCTCRWRYSPSKAGRYIAAARCIEKFPAARSLLAGRKITMCGLAKIATLLTVENSEDLFREVSEKRYVEIEKIVASRQTAPTIRDSVRPIGKNPHQVKKKGREDQDDLFQPAQTSDHSRVRLSKNPSEIPGKS